MAVLGTFGKIVFNRSAPTPVAVDVTALNQDKNIIFDIPYTFCSII